MSANMPPMSQREGIGVVYPQGPGCDWRQRRGKISSGMGKVTEGRQRQAHSAP